MTSAGPPPLLSTPSLPTISSRDNLVARSTTPAPSFTIDEPVRVIGLNIPLQPGESITLTGAGTMVADAPHSAGFIGDFDGPLIGGVSQAYGIVSVNLSSHADAFAFRMETSTGFPHIIHCTAAGAGGGIEITDVPVPSSFVDVAIASAARGIVYRNGAVGESTIQLAKTAVAAPGSVGIEVESSATITGTLGIDMPSLIVGTNKWGVAISSTATISAGALIQVLGAKISGDQGRMFRQDVGDMDVTDDRLIVSGSSSNNWAAVIHAKRTDLALPLIVAYAGFPQAAPTLTPHSTGIAPSLTELTDDHWTLVKDDPGAGDWYIEYTGEKADAPHTVGFDMLVDRNAGTANINACLERSDAPGYASWEVIDSTVRPLANTNTPKRLSGNGDARFNKGDRVRHATENLGDAVSSRIYDLDVTARGS